MLIGYCHSSNFKHNTRMFLRWQAMPLSRPRLRYRCQVMTLMMSWGHMAPGGTGLWTKYSEKNSTGNKKIELITNRIFSKFIISYHSASFISLSSSSPTAPILNSSQALYPFLKELLLENSFLYWVFFTPSTSNMSRSYFLSSWAVLSSPQVGSSLVWSLNSCCFRCLDSHSGTRGHVGSGSRYSGGGDGGRLSWWQMCRGQPEDGTRPWWSLQCYYLLPLCPHILTRLVSDSLLCSWRVSASLCESPRTCLWSLVSFITMLT